MSEENHTIFYQSVANALAEWNLPHDPWASQIVEHISQGTVQWQQEMPDGRSLHLLRVYAPIIQREEVFLGNVLLNDFFFKAIPSAAERIGIKQFMPVANDLESAYFLICGNLDIADLRLVFRDQIIKLLSSLYFGTRQPEKGIHGDFRNLFYFEKSDFEPFPIYAVPEFLARDLEKAVRNQLKELLIDNGYENRLKTVRSALSFFYGRTSGGQGDAQSFDMFVYRLATEYGVIQNEEIKKLFGIEHVDKPAIKAAYDQGQFDPEAYKEFLLRLITDFGKTIDSGASDWLLGFIYQDSKMVTLNEEQFANEILFGNQIGFLPVVLSSEKDSEKACCPVCGQRSPYIRESYIVAGRAKGRFKTRNTKRGANRQESVLCTKCGLCVYLAQRLLGSYEGVWQQQPRKTARMPAKHNIVLHYGQHTEDERNVFEQQLDYLIKYARADKGITELKEGLTAIRREILEITEIVEIDDLFEPWDEAAIEIIAQLESQSRSKVLALGSGDYRLFLFILPQFNSAPKESEDFIQERFSGSRLAVFTLLALLRQLCRCHGSYFYRSLPQLSVGIEEDIFYVADQRESASEALRRYGAIVHFAKRVNQYQKGHPLLTGWILLAERLLEDPLGIFSDVLRASPIRIGDDFSNSKFKYKRLLGDNESAKGLGVVDSTEYLALYEQLHELAKEMN